MLRRLRLRRSFWSVLALGLFSIPAVMGGNAAAPAESQDLLPPPEPNPLATLPPDPADLLARMLKSQTKQIDDLAPDDYQLLVIEAANRHKIDPRLVAAVVTVETKWNTHAVGSFGELGLMQILPSTGAYLARAMGKTGYDLRDPATNLDMGAFYLASLIAEYDTPGRALAAYNGGPSAATAWETNRYVNRVMKVYNQPKPNVAKPAPRTHDHLGRALAFAS